MRIIKNQIHKLLAIAALFIIPNLLSAQKIEFEFGRCYSSFEYKDSDGEELDNMQGEISNHLGLGVKIPITKQFYGLTQASYNQYAAKGSDALVGNYYDWNTNYLGVNIGVGYEFIKSNARGYLQSNGIRSDLTIFTQLAVAAEFLINGTQTINSQLYSLKGVEQFDTPFVFAKGDIGVNYYASRVLAIYLKYTGGMSFPVFKPKVDDNEELNFITHTVSVGIQLSLPYNKYY